MPTYYGHPSDEMLTTPDEITYSPYAIQAGAMGEALGTPFGALQAGLLTANEQTPTGNAAVASTLAPAPAPSSMVNIAPRQWLENVAGPVPLDGRGISMKGGGPYVPEQMSGSYAEYLRQKDAFDRENRLAAIAANAPLGQAEQAVNRALRLEAQLNLASDIKSGMPTYQALAKNFAGLNAGATGPQTMQAASALERMAPAGPPELFNIGGQQFVRGANLHPLTQQMPMGQPGEAIPASEIKTPSGEVVGYGTRTPKGGLHTFQKQREDQVTYNNKIRIIGMKLDQIKSEMKAAELLPTKKEQQKRFKELQDERKQLYKELEDMNVPKVRDKSTGQQHYYTGNTNELPDTHELLDGEDEEE